MKEKYILEKRIEKGDFNKGGEASSKLKDLLRKLGVDSAVIRKTAIVTYELEMNIIIHSEGGWIRAAISREGIQIFAADDGPGIADLERPFNQAIQLPVIRSGRWALGPAWVWLISKIIPMS